jgi:hypothetical protein
MSLQAKLLTIQQNLPEFKKNARNPHFKNSYITLDAILEGLLPMLNKQGILLLQAPTGATDKPTLLTELTDVESGESFSTVTPLFLDKEDSQKHGSSITYARRYALSCIFNIVADEDDDGEVGSSRASNASSGASGQSGSSATF